VTDELRRLRAQLSNLQSLLTLSKLMGDSGDQLRIAHLAGTAVPSLARCQLVGVELAGAGWGWSRRPSRRPRSGSCCSRSPSRLAWR